MIHSPAGVRLVQDASLGLNPGEVALLLGRSGSGKSTIASLLCGLLDASRDGWLVEGTATYGGAEIDLASERLGIGTIVFQGKALFDDLTAIENLRIVADHNDARSPETDLHVARMLQGVPANVPVGSLSGGQQQRVAIARTLLVNRPLVVFDEPNSGLDIAASRRLAELISMLCRVTGRSALIVAHHFEDLLPIADRVYLLDAEANELHDLSPGDEAIRQLLARQNPGPDETGSGAAADRRSHWRLGQRPGLFWLFRYMPQHFWLLCASPLMMLYVAVASMVVGGVSIWFGFNYHSFGGYLRSLLHDETLAGTGLVQTSITMPLIIGILIASRNCAVIAADIGHKVRSSQIDAMENLRVPAMRYMSISIVANMAIGAAFLYIAGVSVAAWTSMQIWGLIFPSHPFEMFHANYLRVVFRSTSSAFASIGWGMVKVTVSAAAAGALAILVGLRSRSPRAPVSRSIGLAVTVGVVATLAVNAVITVLVRLP
jgi:ABC-type lipoprotein export system ATPase subunit/ABC-type transporter Mla maintaining outer membrane lipid asymmetry permease subunit MlaE